MFQSLKLGLSNSNSQVTSQTLTTARGALRRLDLQDASLLKNDSAYKIIVQLIDRLGDNNEHVCQLARDCLAIIWRSSSIRVESDIKQFGYRHRLARVREQSIRWTAKMASDKVYNLPFRSFTNYLIATLEDADSSVRDAAKQTIIDLFLTVPPHARADLRREMKMQMIRKSTMQHILAHLDIADGPELNLAQSTSSAPDEILSRSSRRIVTPGSQAEGSIVGSVASTYVGSLPGSEMEALDPANVFSGRDLEHEMSAMIPHFEGRESERNWLNREKSLNRLRALLRGNSTRDYHVILVTGLRALLEGIIKGMTSLRTSLCLVGLQLTKDLCIVLGPGADPFVEQLLGTLVKLTGATKKIQAQAANITINVLIAHVSYHPRLLQHLYLAIQDKNVAPRMFATAWLRLLLEVHAEPKAQIEHSGLEVLDKSIRKGLVDANPGVREGMRATYWKYTSIWPEKGATIMTTVQGAARKQLEKANPSLLDPASATNTISVDTRNCHNQTISSVRPFSKNLTGDRTKAEASMASTSVPKQLVSSNPCEARPELRSLLSSGPQRSGLGSAIRPATSQARKVNTAKPEETLRSSTRSMSSTHGATPVGPSLPKVELVPSPRRRKPITEQLESEDWRIRVEGVVTLACLLANKEPPNVDGQKITLPSSETLAPILRKLMADSQAEVVDHLMAPEVIAEIAKIIEWDAILPRVLLMSETDESETGHDVKSDSLPAIKAMFDDNAAVHQCLDTLALLKVAGHQIKPLNPAIKPNFRFTTAQKRPIIKAVLLWLIELVERHQAAVGRGEAGNPAFAQNSEYKMIMNRIMFMMTNIQPSSINYAPLATFLKALRKSDEASFDKNLSTFEKPVIIALKKAWGEKPSDEEELDEPVADVRSVLGTIPVVSDSSLNHTNLRMDTLDTPLTQGMLPPLAESQSATPPRDKVSAIPVYQSNSPDANDNEDLTMIPIQHLFVPKTPAGFRQALHMVDSPWSTNGSANASPNGSPKRKISDGKENLDTEVVCHGMMLNINDNDNLSTDTVDTVVRTDFWFRKQMKDQALLVPLSQTIDEQKILLRLLTVRLEDLDLDTVGFRKLMKIVRENPTQNYSRSEVADSDLENNLWANGTSYERMVVGLLNFLSSLNGSPELKVQALLLLKLSFISQPRYFKGHEARAISTILGLRSVTDSQSLATGLEELAPELMFAASPSISIITTLQCLHTYVVGNKASWRSNNLPTLQLAINGLSISVARLSINELEGFAQALAQLVVKALNDEFEANDIEIAEIRRSTVNLCMAMYHVIKDTRVVLSLLSELKPSQQNLLTYYFANKSLGT